MELGKHSNQTKKSWIRFRYMDIGDKVFPGRGNNQGQRHEGGELWRLRGALQENSWGETGKVARDSWWRVEFQVKDSVLLQKEMGSH